MRTSRVLIYNRRDGYKGVMQPIFRIARNGKIHLCTQSFGSPGDPGIVLVMGATASMMWWPDALCEALASSGRYVVRFDHRDTGDSTTGTPGQADYAVVDLADDVIAVIDEHGLDSAHLVGMSLGAFIAQLIALRDPNRVRTLTLIASEPLGGEPVDAAGLDPVLLEHFATMDDLDWSDPKSARGFLSRIAMLSASPTRGYDKENADERIDREIARASTIRAAFNHMSVSKRAN